MSAGSKRIIGQQAGREKNRNGKERTAGFNQSSANSLCEWLTNCFGTTTDLFFGGCWRCAASTKHCSALFSGRSPAWMSNPAEKLTDTWLTHMLSRPGSGAVTDSQNRARAPHASKPHTGEILPFLSFEASGRGPASTKGCFFRKLHNLALYQICNVVLIPLCGCKTETCR